MPSATELDRQAAVLDARYGNLDGEALLRPLIEHEFRGRIALLSSFGTEAALLLHMVAQVDADVPVIFLDTGKLFGETLRYRDTLVARLRLRDLRVVAPDPVEVTRRDPEGTLWHSDADACCRLRKLEPLERALHGFVATIAGRKQYQAGARSAVRAVEAVGSRIQVNPLASFTRERVEHQFAMRDLPRHPLEADGFLSIGCMPCTDRIAPGEDRRAGRWRGLDKDECGIHLAPLRNAGGVA